MSLEGLNAKQRAFIREYAITKNATQAAINAGYSRETAAQQGSRLLSHVKICEAIEAQEKGNAAQCGITVETITKMLQEDRELAKEHGQAGAAVSASLGLAKLHGLIEEKQRLSGAVGTNYAAVTIPTAERDTIPTVDAAARSPVPRDQKASRH